jgi:predicted TIM-barrel fold metal-dependent hydrolase
VRRVIGVEEHAWTAELRDALLRFGGDDTVTMLSSQKDTDRRLREVGDERLARMDAAGVDLQVLSITTPGTQSLPAAEAVPLARDANDFLADAVRRRPDRFAAFATLPTPDPQAAATELERCVTQLHLVDAMLLPRTGEVHLDHDKFRPVFEVAAGLQVPLYIHPALPPQPVRDAYFSGFDDFTNMVLSAGGWGWHADAGLALDVLGPDRVMYGTDDPYGSAGYTSTISAPEFVATAPINAQAKAKLAHLNAERLLGTPSAETRQEH